MIISQIAGRMPEARASYARALRSRPTDPEIRRREARIWARFYAMMAGGCLRQGCGRESLRWALRALHASPSVAGYLLAPPIRRLQRLWVAQKKQSFAHDFPFACASSS